MQHRRNRRKCSIKRSGESILLRQLCVVCNFELLHEPKVQWFTSFTRSMPGIFGSKFLVDLELYIDGYIDGYNMMLCDAICKVHWLVETQTAAFRRFSCEYSDRVRYGQIFCLDDAHLCTRREGPVLDVTMKHPHHQPLFQFILDIFAIFCHEFDLGQYMARQVGKKSVANLLQDSSLVLTFASSGGYATAMVLELYADSSGFLVRILRDGQPLKLGICESKASCSLRGGPCGLGGEDWTRIKLIRYYEKSSHFSTWKYSNMYETCLADWSQGCGHNLLIQNGRYQWPPASTCQFANLWPFVQVLCPLKQFL